MKRRSKTHHLHHRVQVVLPLPQVLLLVQAEANRESVLIVEEQDILVHGMVFVETVGRLYLLEDHVQIVKCLSSTGKETTVHIAMEQGENKTSIKYLRII